MNHEKHESYKEIIEEVKSIISQARSLTVRSVNALQVASNYLIGQRNVEFEQGGSRRAEYGKALLKELSNELISEFGRGYSHRNLDLMKNFHLTYKRKGISQTLSAKLVPDSSVEKFETLSGIWKPERNFQGINALKIAQTLSAEFSLSWSHYVFLMAIKNPEERLFYEMESINGGSL